MDQLTQFQSEQFGSLRVFFREDGPWFVARDVAKVLGYTNPPKAIRDHCKAVNDSFTMGNRTPTKIIPESDLYRLILRSKLPSAEAFQDWVTMEVLPAIRKTGAYSVGSTKPAEQEMIASLNARVQALEQAMIRQLSLAPISPRVQVMNMPITVDHGRSVARWIIEECYRTPDCRRSVNTLAEIYNEWAQDLGEPKVSAKRFGIILTDLGIPKVRRSPGMFVALDVNDDFS